jgi:hypothetical protein
MAHSVVMTAQQRSSRCPRCVRRCTSALELALIIGRNDTGVVTTGRFASSRTTTTPAFSASALGCDNGSCPGQEETLSGCSRLDQQPYQFTELFANQN